MQRHRQRGRAAANRDRRTEFRAPRERILIVCEGTKTEPNYFKDLIDFHRLNTAETLDIDVIGTGLNTLGLVEHALSLQKEGSETYHEIWCVLDKDDFTADQFNSAVGRAKDHPFLRIAWSNEAFELWYILHFNYLDSALSRVDYIRILDDLMRTHCNLGYAKNDPKMYTLLGGQRRDQAIKYARRLQGYYSTDTPYHRRQPATMVHVLVKRLLSYAPETKPDTAEIFE